MPAPEDLRVAANGSEQDLPCEEAAQLAGRVMADEGGGLIVLLFRPLAQIGPLSAAYVVTQAGVVGLANAFMSELVEQNVWVKPIQIESPKRTAWQVLEFAQKLK